jgi:hypothetical protein
MTAVAKTAVTVMLCHDRILVDGPLEDETRLWTGGCLGHYAIEKFPRKHDRLLMILELFVVVGMQLSLATIIFSTFLYRRYFLLGRVGIRPVVLVTPPLVAEHLSRAPRRLFYFYIYYFYFILFLPRSHDLCH